MFKLEHFTNMAMSLTEKLEYLKNFYFVFCDNVGKYETLGKVGQGTFGEVFKGRDKQDSTRFVAMKKILMDNERDGFPMTGLREIKILQRLNHENIVRLQEICRGNPSLDNGCISAFYLIFDFCEYDLAGLLGNRSVKFNLGEIKQILQQMLNGLYYMHVNSIIHRDVKTANILINKQGVLKLADFGLSRAFSKAGPDLKDDNRFTTGVVTLWYRPPEILLGDRRYGTPVDLWSAGCIMAEMWTRSPLLPGNTEQEQLGNIAKLCGSITPDVWPNVANLELFKQLILPAGYKRRVVERLRPFLRDAFACDLLDKLLALDPTKRINADDALNHDFFWNDPMPCDLAPMLARLPPNLHQYRQNQQRGPFQQQLPRPQGYRPIPSTSNQSEYHDHIF